MSMQVPQSTARTACLAVDPRIDQRGGQSATLSRRASPQQITSLSLGLATMLIGGVLGSAGAPIALAVAVALLVPFGFHGVPLALEFAIGALTDRRPVARLGCGAALRVWLTETWTALTAFSIDQAWRADFDEPPIKRDPARPAVLFVHGYFCNRGVWRTWIERCRQVDRWNVATVNLEPAVAGIDSYAAQLDAAIARLRRASGADRVTLVCHSMGGLVARAYLRSRGHHAVNRVITINTPHHGTVLANFDRSENARQMRRSCDYLRQLAERPEPVEFICLASHHDNLIVPRDSQVLDCAEAIWFERIGHLAMTVDDGVFECLSEIVERPTADLNERLASSAPSAPRASRLLAGAGEMSLGEAADGLSPCSTAGSHASGAALGLDRRVRAGSSNQHDLRSTESCRRSAHRADNAG